MTTAIVSDLHLGAAGDFDLLRRDELREALLEAIDGARRLVLLGDVIELRDRPLPDALALAAPVLRELAGAVDELVLVPGNHDHRLVASWLERRALDGEPPLGVAERAPDDAFPLPELRERAEAELVVSYPGFWVREDVYATHGHYLDRHLTIPSFERLGLALVERTLGIQPAPPDPPGSPERGDEPHGADDYERVVAPVYAFLFALAQASGRDRAVGTPSRRIWEALTGGESRVARLRGWLLGSVAVPGAVTVANRLGLGPVRADLSPGAITRAGIDAMGEVVERLAIEASWVVFGHTHRRGPLEGEPQWRTPTGPLLLNTGSWVYAPALVRSGGNRSPYWPGSVVLVDETGPPRHVHVLDDWAPAQLDDS